MPSLSKLFRRKSRPPPAANAPAANTPAANPPAANSPATAASPTGGAPNQSAAARVEPERASNAPANVTSHADLDRLTEAFIGTLSMNHLTTGPAQGPPEIPPEFTGQLPFTLQVNPQIWPGFDKSDIQEAMNASGTRVLDFINSLAVQWARGVSVHESQYGVPRFGSGLDEGLEVDKLPPLLYDLACRRVVRSVDLGRANYIAISHVWGSVQEVDGRKYGVDWNIPVRNETTLNQILEAARIVGGSRFIWMDILCMDQRRRNEAEIPLMKSYFANATGCLVWLDNTFNEPHWPGVLDAIEHANKLYHLDRHGVPTMSAMEMIGPNGVLNDMTISEQDIIRWIRYLMLLEKAPWFRRVWTLQEAVIPNRLHFCTPERYMIQEYTLFMTTAICEMLAHSAMQSGSVSGTCVIQLLQNTEVYKLLKLRQAYRKDQLSYWHLSQAIRTRECKYEQDRVFGIYGLLSHPLPPVDYNRPLESLNRDLFRSYLAAGDFTAFLFLGGSSSLLPDPTSSIGLLTPKPNSTGTTILSLDPTTNNLTMNGIAIDPVLNTFYLGTTLPSSTLSSSPSHPLLPITTTPHFLQSTPSHPSLATAFSLPHTQHNTLYTSAYTAQSAPSLLSPAGSAAMSIMGPEFNTHLRAALPSALLTWTRMTFLAQGRDVAFAVVTSDVSGAQVAVVTEAVPRQPGGCLLVMPGEYMEGGGGEGCLLCVPTGDGNELRKIGVGLGRGLKGIGLVKTTLVDG